MATFWVIARKEAIHLWQQRSFWVIQVLLLLLPTPFIAGGAPIPAALVLLYLAIPFLVGLELLDYSDSPGELLWSSPTSVTTHYAGVIAGLWLGLLPGSLLQLAGWFLASLFFPNIISGIGLPANTFSFWIWPASLAFLLLANTVGLFLTTLLAMLVRRLGTLLIIWTALWLWAFAELIVKPGFAETHIPMQAIIFNNVFFLGLPFSPSLGLGLSQARVFGMAAWFLGLGLLAVSLGLPISLLADRRWSVRHAWVLPVLILAGALAAAGGYALNARAAAEVAVQVSPYDPQIDAWAVERQQTDVVVNAATGEISGTSRLVLNPVRPPARPELVLRLNPGLGLAYARDGSGADLSARRVGDSLVVSLPAVPTEPVQLELSWQGHLQISYLSFEQTWSFRDFPGEIPYYTMPAPLKALLTSQGGYLLRDGDWMPWPWTSTPHQAGQNSLTIHPVGGEAVAARPIQAGAVTWEGEIPQGLVAFLPSKQIALDRTVLAASPLAGSQHIARGRLFEAQAAQLAAFLGEQPPRYIIVAPYLNELVWSGDLLLIPDGGGAYQSTELYSLLRNNVNGPKRPLLERNALFELARTWIHNHFRQTRPFQAVLSPTGEDTQVKPITQIPEDVWYQDHGHWMQLAEAIDTTNLWDPHTNYQLNPPGEQSVLAFWLAMELVDESTRQADLDLLAYFEREGQKLYGEGANYARIFERLWPDILYATKGREMVQDLHEWALQVGPEEALRITVEVIEETNTWDLSLALAEMEARSGVPIGGSR